MSDKTTKPKAYEFHFRNRNCNSSKMQSVSFDEIVGKFKNNEDKSFNRTDICRFKRTGNDKDLVRLRTVSNLSSERYSQP